MLNPSKNEGLAEGLPLTHSAYIAACASMTTKHGGRHRPWVQIRKRDPGGHAVLCGQVAELDAGKADEWFKVDTAIGSMWATSRNVRMCSGDGRCTCEPDEPSQVATC